MGPGEKGSVGRFVPILILGLRFLLSLISVSQRWEAILIEVKMKLVGPEAVTSQSVAYSGSGRGPSQHMCPNKRVK